MCARTDLKEEQVKERKQKKKRIEQTHTHISSINRQA